MRILLGLFLSLLHIGGAMVFAQSPPPPSKPQFFLDCTFCDHDFIRSEIKFVDYVTDRAIADVHALITTETNGSGGETYTIDLMGLQRFQSLKQTLKFGTSGADTGDHVRKKLVQHLKVGLVPFVSATPTLASLQIGYTPPSADPNTLPVPLNDKWNLWNFRIGTNANIEAESSYKSANYSGRFNANRTSDKWKTYLSAYLSKNRNEFTYTNDQNRDTTLINLNKNWSVNSSAIRTLAKQSSGRVSVSLFGSTYNNVLRNFQISPGYEYSFTPYEESTRRAFKLQWNPNIQFVEYEEITLFDKKTETLFQNRLSAILSQQQPWGSASLTLTGTHYLHDFQLWQLSLIGNVEWRITKGLSFSVGGSFASINDQISLPKNDPSSEDILTRFKQQKTNFRYWTFMGLSYRFGALTNNIVNSRFDEGGGFYISY